jgi:hypothetical protein
VKRVKVSSPMPLIRALWERVRAGRCRHEWRAFCDYYPTRIDWCTRCKDKRWWDYETLRWIKGTPGFPMNAAQRAARETR